MTGECEHFLADDRRLENRHVAIISVKYHQILTKFYILE